MYERIGLYSEGQAPHAIASFRREPLPGVYRRFSKRALDIFLVLLVAPISLVIVGLAASIVALREGGKPFYRQERVGQNGRVFGMWKLRTMVPGADAALSDYLAANPEARAEWNKHQKLRNDPRITRLGRFLRRSSLDELPQLWNVFVGDMSIVGPRPMMCDQRVLYPGTEYYEMRPGITGFWQVSERNETSFHERAGFDQAYFRQISFGTDMSVMFRTVGAVLRATGH